MAPPHLSNVATEMLVHITDQLMDIIDWGNVVIAEIFRHLYQNFFTALVSLAHEVVPHRCLFFKFCFRLWNQCKILRLLVPILTYLKKKVFSSIFFTYYAVYTPLLYGFVSVGETQYIHA